MRAIVVAFSLVVAPFHPAGAADPVVPPVAVPFSWTGAYVGAHGGYVWSGTDWTLIDNAGDGACNRCGSGVTDFTADGIAGGIYAGYNYQFRNNLVLGGEAEFTLMDAGGSGGWQASGGRLRTASADANWMVSAGPRLGYAFGTWLPYLEGGVAIMGVDYTHTNLTSGNSFTGEDTRVGWYVGGGLSVALSENWSVKAEYNYADFGESRVDLDGIRQNGQPGTAVFDVEQDMHLVRVGIDFRF